MKVYLDYQVWDYINKDIKFKNYFTGKDDWDYYISVAHLEELYRAKKNEKDDKLGMTNALEKTIREIAEDGVIKPAKQGVMFMPKGYEKAYQDIVNIDTESIIYKNSLFRRDMDKNSYDPQDLFRGIKHDKNDEYRKVWDTERVKLELANCAKNYEKLLAELKSPQNSLRRYYVNTYGEGEGMRFLNELLENVKTPIHPAAYNEIRDNYGKLEYVMEQLYFVLSKCGFKRDNTDKLANSGTYDIQHSICATLCDIFITNDIGFADKYKAVAFYLAIPVRIITLGEIYPEITQMWEEYSVK